MDDLISRQSAIDIAKELIITINGYEQYNQAVNNYSAMIMQLPPAQPDNQVHLCDSCSYTYPECPSVYTNMIFGNGTGNDNICACSKYMPSAQPEPCEDAVNRAEVLRMINCINDHHDITPYKSVGATTEHLTRIASNLPPVMPKQRTGHWYPVGMVEAVGGESAQWGSAIAYHKCSECDGQALKDDFEKEVLSKWCPHCGARMK